MNYLKLLGLSIIGGFAGLSPPSFSGNDSKENEPRLIATTSGGACPGGVDFDVISPSSFRKTKYFSIFLEIEKNHRQVYHSYLDSVLNQSEGKYVANFCLSYEYLRYAKLTVIYSGVEGQHYEFYTKELANDNGTILTNLTFYEAGELHPLRRFSVD